MRKAPPTNVTVNQPEPEAAIDENAINPEEIALDLDATARSAADGRLFWNGDRLVKLGSHNIDCSLLLSKLDAEAKNAFKWSALSFADSRHIAVSSFVDLIRAFSSSSKSNPPRIFDSHWVSHALNSTPFRCKKYSARIFLEHIKECHSNLVTDDALNLLAQVARNSNSSSNVTSDHPEKSWLTDEEYDDVLRVTWEHYDQHGATQAALIRLLSLQYARRPIQLSSLKFGDLKSSHDKVLAELQENEIHFPAAKERHIEKEFRGGKFEAHPIAEHLWNLLKIQRKEIKILFERLLGTPLTDSAVDDLPVFTTGDRITKAMHMLEENLRLNPKEHLGDELFHLKPDRLGLVISFTYNLHLSNGDGLAAPHVAPPELPRSRRTGKPIVVTATRLRHTRVRQLARQGVPKHILSYWLGHNNDDALKSYYNDPAEEARQIDEYMSPGLAPIAQAFHGRIIATDAEATHPNDPLKRLELAKDGQLNYVGRCGKFSFCATTSIPIPCYRCRSFEPLADAPHEEVLEALLYRQTQERAVIKPGSLRNLLIPIDLSADIRAVERCIALCKAKREQK